MHLFVCSAKLRRGTGVGRRYWQDCDDLPVPNRQVPALLRWPWRESQQCDMVQFEGEMLLRVLRQTNQGLGGWKECQLVVDCLRKECKVCDSQHCVACGILGAWRWQCQDLLYRSGKNPDCSNQGHNGLPNKLHFFDVKSLPGFGVKFIRLYDSLDRHEDEQVHFKVLASGFL
jgi:hypothetical protein